MNRNNVKNIWQVARDVGLESIRCPSCGKKINGMETLFNFFARVVQLCQTGVDVRIKNFGTFKAKKLKGRKIESSALDNGKAEFSDQLVLRFHQSTICKDILNNKKRGSSNDTN